MTMSISQALRAQKKLKGQVAELQTRFATTITFSVDSPPAFSYEETKEALKTAKDSLLALSTRITVTNAVTKCEDMPLAGCVLRLQELKSSIALLKNLKVLAHAEMTKREIVSYSNPTQYIDTKTVCKMPETEKVKNIEALQNEFDRLNDSVERVNHSTTLVAE